MTSGWFSEVEEFWNGFLFQESSDILSLISWNIRLFWISSFAKDVLLQKIDCVFVLAIRGLLHMTKNFVLWCDFAFLITLTESFSLKSFLRNDIIMVLSKTCVRFRNRIFKRVWISLDQIVFFPWLLGKRFVHHYGKKKVWKCFHFGNWPFLCLRKLNFWVWEGDFESSLSERS